MSNNYYKSVCYTLMKQTILPLLLSPFFSLFHFFPYLLSFHFLSTVAIFSLTCKQIGPCNFTIEFVRELCSYSTLLPAYNKDFLI